MLTDDQIAQKGKEGNKAFRLWHAVNFALQGRHSPAPDVLSAMEYIVKCAPDVYKGIASADRSRMPPPPWDPNGIAAAKAVEPGYSISGLGRSTVADKTAEETASLTKPTATSRASATVEPDAVEPTPSKISLAADKPVSRASQESASINALRALVGVHDPPPSLHSVASTSNAPPECIPLCPLDCNASCTPTSHKAEVLAHLKCMITVDDVQTSITRIHRAHLANLTQMFATASDCNGIGFSNRHPDFGERWLHAEFVQEVARYRMTMSTVTSSLQRLFLAVDGDRR